MLGSLYVFVMDHFQLLHLRALESESIHMMCETAAQFQRPVLLYSIGRDSSLIESRDWFVDNPISFNPSTANNFIQGEGI